MARKVHDDIVVFETPGEFSQLDAVAHVISAGGRWLFIAAPGSGGCRPDVALDPPQDRRPDAKRNVSAADS